MNLIEKSLLYRYPCNKAAKGSLIVHVKPIYDDVITWEIVDCDEDVLPDELLSIEEKVT